MTLDRLITLSLCPLCGKNVDDYMCDDCNSAIEYYRYEIYVIYAGVGHYCYYMCETPFKTILSLPLAQVDLIYLNDILPKEAPWNTLPELFIDLEPAVKPFLDALNKKDKVVSRFETLDLDASLD